MQIIKRKIKEKIGNSIKSIFASINETPIIILGNQKSGTSAIAHLLADHGNLSKTIDIPEMWQPTLSLLLSNPKNLYKFIHNNRLAFSKEVIKEPNLTFLFHYLVKYFSNARYILVVRDPRDNIRSMLNRVKILGNLKNFDITSYSISENWKILFNSHIWGINATHYIEILSERWNITVDVYLNNQQRVYLAQYEDFIKDKVGYIGDLAANLGIHKKRDIRQLVDIQYQPRGKDRNVSWEKFFGQENLNRIERICASRMKKFGYSLYNKT